MFAFIEKFLKRSKYLGYRQNESRLEGNIFYKSIKVRQNYSNPETNLCVYYNKEL